MRKLLILIGLLVAAASLEAQTMRVRYGAGIDRAFGERLNDVLAANGLAELNQGSLLHFDAAFGFPLGAIDLIARSGRTASDVFAKPTGAKRTRFLEDDFAVLAGHEFKTLGRLYLGLFGGVGVSKYLLQTYAATPIDLAGAAATAGQLSLVSSYNWNLAAAASAAWKIAADYAKVAFAVGLTVDAAWYPLEPTWRVADDVAIGGVGKPWEFFTRYTLWVGIE
jgi:hypothetical protein